MSEAWLNVSPLDNQLDGGGFADFERTFPMGTVVTLTAAPTYQGRTFLVWKLDGVMQAQGVRFVDVTITETVQTLDLEAVYFNVNHPPGSPSGQYQGEGADRWSPPNVDQPYE